jgi:hypothetical protein
MIVETSSSIKQKAPLSRPIDAIDYLSGGPPQAVLPARKSAEGFGACRRSAAFWITVRFHLKNRASVDIQGRTANLLQRGRVLATLQQL